MPVINVMELELKRQGRTIISFTHLATNGINFSITPIMSSDIAMLVLPHVYQQEKKNEVTHVRSDSWSCSSSEVRARFTIGGGPPSLPFSFSESHGRL